MSVYNVRNPEFERDLREGFARQSLMSSFGARLETIAPGEVDIAIDARADLLQQNGFVHAGVLTSIADSACGGAAITLMPPDSDVLSIEFKVNLLAPAAAPRFVARARVLRAGKTITVCRADVFGIDGANETLVATMLGTMMTRSR
jgi:uncharacterized protein (TIGR00369 family)